MFAGFIPRTEYYNFKDKRLVRKMHSKKIRTMKKTKGFATACNSEILDSHKAGDDWSFEVRNEIYKQEYDLEFIKEDRNIDDAEIEGRIEKEMRKTGKEKVKDHRRLISNLPMSGGGPNDFMQAVFQALAGLSWFVRFFLRGRHLKPAAGTPKKKPVSAVLAQVFESLARPDFNV
jgi:hypothetical protein